MSSFAITPPCGSGVSLSIPKISSAREFTQPLCHDQSIRKTGLSGAISSRISRGESSDCSNNCGYHWPPRTHSPSGVADTQALSASRTASRSKDRKWHSSCCICPASDGWMCVSWMPGITMRPPRSCTAVASPTNLRMSSALPSAVILPSVTAIASAQPRPGATV